LSFAAQQSVDLGGRIGLNLNRTAMQQSHPQPLWRDSMYEKIFEQAQTAIKPLSELMTLNAKIFEDAAQKQAAYFKDFVNDSVAFAKDVSSQKDYSGVYQTQKAYLEGLQSKWISASTEAYESITSSQEKWGEVIKKSSTV
jgi:phasin family protein